MIGAGCDCDNNVTRTCVYTTECTSLFTRNPNKLPYFTPVGSQTLSAAPCVLAVSCGVCDAATSVGHGTAICTVAPLARLKENTTLKPLIHSSFFSLPFYVGHRRASHAEPECCHIRELSDDNLQAYSGHTILKRESTFIRVTHIRARHEMTNTKMNFHTHPESVFSSRFYSLFTVWIPRLYRAMFYRSVFSKAYPHAIGREPLILTVHHVLVVLR